MLQNRAYSMAVKVKSGDGFESLKERVTAALAEEGFGILTEIDVRETLKKKLDVDFRPYLILGACNPPLAHRALEAEEDLGVLLPCNVILYENQDDTFTVSALDPVTQFSLVRNPELEPVAVEVRSRLARALETLV